MKPWNNIAQGFGTGRVCPQCGSNKPGGIPLNLKVNGQLIRGYWHLKCFELARKDLIATGNIKDKRK
jgi:hypothetical protein